MQVMREIKTPLPFWKMKRFVVGIPLIFLLIFGFVGYKVAMNLASEKMIDELASQLTKEDYDNLLKDPSIQQIINKERDADKKSELLNNISSDPTIKEAIRLNLVASNSKDTSNATTGIAGEEKNPTTTTTGKAKDTVATVVRNQGKTEVKQPTVEKVEPSLEFDSSSEVMEFLLSKFTTEELSELAKKAEGGVTPQEKEDIKSTVLGRLSAEEYNAMKAFAVVEVSKRQ